MSHLSIYKTIKDVRRKKKKKMLETVTFDLCLLSDIALSFLL
jgi:hypothetical protein